MESHEPTGLTWATTDELAREIHSRYPHMMLVFEKDASPEDPSTMNIYGPDGTAAGIARAMGLLEAAKQQMQFDFLLLQRGRH